MATITIADSNARNLTLTYNDGVVTTTYTILKYTCSIEQDGTTLHLRWRNDATDSRLYFSVQWSEVTSPVTADADALKVLLLQYLKNCSQERNVVVEASADHVVTYDDVVIQCLPSCTTVNLLTSTNRRPIWIVNSSNSTITINVSGSDIIKWRGSNSSSFNLNNDHEVYLMPNGVDKYYVVSHNNIQP